ncbi:MAG TPA: hypothetical protein VJK48_06170 [Chlamydiales bacterium]|nr:hypothetical protein [Chlamydiales bacterium]
MVSPTTSATCSYVESKWPGRYGNQQEDYIKRTTQATLEIVKELPSKKNDLQAFFFRCLEDLGKLRRQIAQDHQTLNAETFGKRREDETVPCEFTALGAQYKEYNQKIIDSVHQHFLDMYLGAERQTARILQDKSLGRCSRFQIRVLEQRDIVEQKWCIPLGVEPEFRSKKEPVEEKIKIEAITDRRLLKDLKERQPALYERERMCALLYYNNVYFPAVKGQTCLYNGYILGTSELEINGKMRVLSQYLTWLSWDDQENVFDRMKRCATMVILHHDLFEIEETLKDVAKIFEQAVLWNSKEESLEELKNRVGLFRYELAHAMPFVRGSSAVGEMFEAALYWYHGFSNFRHFKPVDLEALTALLLTDYLKTYHEIVVLEKVSSSAV